MSAGDSQRELIHREIAAKTERIRGKVASEPRLVNFDQVGSSELTLVCSVDVGGNRIIENVPIKLSGQRGRAYAQIGMPVFLERNAAGRVEIVAPGDRVIAQTLVEEYDEDAESTASGTPIGFTYVRVPFSYYADNGLWNDGVTDFPLVRILDGSGQQVN